MTKTTITTVDDYIAQFPAEIQQRLRSLRKIIADAAPTASERIAYGMPAFERHGILVYYAAWKQHLGFYPTGSGIERFKQELQCYVMSKGTLQIPFNEPIPEGLIQDIVKFRVQENENRLALKKASLKKKKA